MSDDRFRDRRRALLGGVRDGSGETESALRHAAMQGDGVPERLQPLVRKIHDHAYKVTDDDITELKADLSEDALFEIIVCAALGAADHRFTRGMQALVEADVEDVA